MRHDDNECGFKQKPCTILLYPGKGDLPGFQYDCKPGKKQILDKIPTTTPVRSAWSCCMAWGNSLHCPDRLNAEMSPALSRRRSCIQVQSVICRNAPPSTDRAETSLLAWVHQPDWAEPCPMH